MFHGRTVCVRDIVDNDIEKDAHKYLAAVRDNGNDMACTQTVTCCNSYEGAR